MDPARADPEWSPGFLKPAILTLIKKGERTTYRAKRQQGRGTAMDGAVPDFTGAQTELFAPRCEATGDAPLYGKNTGRGPIQTPDQKAIPESVQAPGVEFRYVEHEGKDKSLDDGLFQKVARHAKSGGTS